MKVDRLQRNCEHVENSDSIKQGVNETFVVDRVQVQKSKILFHVVDDKSDGSQKWDKQYKLRNGVEVFQYTHPFEHFGDVVFQRYKGKNRDVVLVSLPRFLVPKDEVRDGRVVEQFLVDLAMRVAPLFQRRFHIRLGLPELVDKPDFAVPVKEPMLAEMAERYTFSVGEVKLDASPPDNLPEFESKNPVHVVNYLESMQKISELENAVRTIFGILKVYEDKTIAVVSKVSQLSEVSVRLSEQLGLLPELNERLKALEGLDELKSRLDGLAEEIKKLNKLFEERKRPDEFRDVA